VSALSRVFGRLRRTPDPEQPAQAAQPEQPEKHEEPDVPTTPRQTVEAFLTGFRHLDTDAALSTVSADAQVNLYPLQKVDGGRDDMAGLLQEISRALPDLLLTIRSVIELGQVVVAEIKIEGTQAADFLGVVNQEKHLDWDTAWRFTVTGDSITGIDVYWCQNQFLRRLGVKRTDQIAIV
jgi:limonene-1,2-epoxide hydrolase